MNSDSMGFAKVNWQVEYVVGTVGEHHQGALLRPAQDEGKHKGQQRNQIFNKFKWPAYVNLDSVLPDKNGMEVESEGVTEEVVVKMLW